MTKVSKSKQLGRGLSSLLGDNLNVNDFTRKDLKNNLSIVPIDYLSAGSWQVRKNFDENELNSLSQSIKNNGIFQPIVVISDKENNGKYKIVAGERRWRAAQLANIHEVPVILRDDLSSEKIVEISLLENLERSDLNPIEEAKGYEDLINEHNYTQEKVAQMFSKSRPYITNFLRLLTLSNEIKTFIEVYDNENFNRGCLTQAIELFNEILKYSVYKKMIVYCRNIKICNISFCLMINY